MLDRFGSTVRVGWPQHHLIYIEAALTLPRDERTAAFQDIADLTGRNLDSVRSKAYEVLQAQIDTKARTKMEASVKPKTSVLVPTGRRVLPPSELNPLSEARKMGAR